MRNEAGERINSGKAACDMGTAGLSLFCGTEPVIATVIMQGVLIKRLL
jgi:hypothetical protein